MGRNFKFQAQDSFFGIIFLGDLKIEALFLKKRHLQLLFEIERCHQKGVIFQFSRVTKLCSGAARRPAARRPAAQRAKQPDFYTTLEIQFTLIFKGLRRISVTVSVYVVVALRLSSSRVSAVVVVNRGGSPDCACVRRRKRRAATVADGTPAPAGLVSLCTAAHCTRPPPLLLSQVSQVTCKCNATTHYYDYLKAPLTTNLMIVVFEN